MKYVYLNILVQWLGLIANIVSILSICQILWRLYSETLRSVDLMVLFVILLGGIIVRLLSSYFSSVLSYRSSERVKLTLREKIYKKVLSLGNSYKERTNTSEVIQVAVEGVDQLETYFGKYLPQLFYSLLAPLTLFAVLAFVNFPSALVLLICVPLIPVSIIAIQKFAKKLLSKYWGTYTELGDSFLENLQGLTTLKIYNVDEQKNTQMNDQAEKFRKITMKVLIMQLNSVTLMDLIAYGGAALGIIVSVTQFLSGAVEFAGCFSIILLAADFFIPLRLLGSFFHIAMNGIAASEKIFSLLDTPEPKKGTRSIDGRPSEIDFTDINFSYDGERTTIKGMNFTLKGSGMTAIVGESGSGKSTITTLITGQHKAFSGELTVDGKEIEEINEESLMKNITLVSHNSYLFKGTVKENLLLGDKDADDDELWEALKKVNLSAFLEGEDGLSTEILEKGANLSGGQCQRLALARALLHKSPIYIFDEATSNIDAQSEKDISKIITELSENKMVLMISHRLKNIVGAKEIIVLAGGEIAERGTHENLLREQGIYAKLYSEQMKLEGIGKGEINYA